MKRSFWIISTAILAVLVIGGTATWWLLASGWGAREQPPLDTTGLVYTGADLAGFLLDQETAREVTGTGIELGAVDNEFNSGDPGVFDPVDCTEVATAPALFPAGFRKVNGSHTPGEEFFPRLDLSHSAYQFSTVADAIEAFTRIEAAIPECGDFVISAPDGGRASSVELTSVATGEGADSLAVLLDYSGYEQARVARVVQRVDNVISLAILTSTGLGTDWDLEKSTVERLASAVHERAARAAYAKATGGTVELAGPSASAAPSKSSAWLIDFGSIGPVDITMTAERAAGVLGVTETMSPDMEECSTYSLGSLFGLAESQGARGPLDSLTYYPRFEEQSLDVGEWPKDGPRTAAGIMVGSTLAELQAAYPGRLDVRRHTYVEGWHYVDLYGPGETVMVFHTNSENIVVLITTGRVPQAQFVEGCA